MDRSKLITVTVRYFDGFELCYTILPNMLVKDFKELVDAGKILYAGQQPEDGYPLSKYGVKDGCVISAHGGKNILRVRDNKQFYESINAQKIELICVSNEEKYKIYVTPDNFIWELKWQIQILYKIPATEQNLFYNGQKLRDSETIGFHKIVDKNATKIELQQKDLSKLIYLTCNFDGEIFKISVDTEDLIADLKCYIQMVCGILHEDQQLFYNETVLEDSDKIGLYIAKNTSFKNNLEIRKKFTIESTPNISTNLALVEESVQNINCSTEGDVNRKLDLVEEPRIQNYTIDSYY